MAAFFLPRVGWRPILVALAIGATLIVVAAGRPPAPRQPAPAGTDAIVGRPAAWIASAPREARCPGAQVEPLVAWTSDSVLLSRDGGRTIHRVLDHEGEVRDVLLDCAGGLHVLRGDGLLGTLDESGAEQWQRVARFESATRLMADIDGVAVIGVDPDDWAELLLARRDRRGRWKTHPLVVDLDYQSYDGIEVLAVESVSPTRRRLLVRPWQGGECGTDAYLEATVDLDRYRVRIEVLGELPPRYR